jgi:dihydrofolate synthase / folylpolyglutamate synthase
VYHGGTVMDGLVYLNSLQPWQGRGNFSLTAVKSVLKYFGSPQNQFRSIHVTGTNGKGSVCAAVAEILQHEGFSVGLTISPHLVRVNERIVINGNEISIDTLDNIGITIRNASLSLNVTLSFHEALTVAAFLAFYESKVDWAVVEVGLGGRLDSSNVMWRPALSILTTIARDHIEILGGSERSIAIEKSGIIKSYSQVVVGNIHPELQSIIAERCVEKRSRLMILGRDFEVKDQTEDTFVYSSSNEQILVTKSLLGDHQAENMAVAFHACRVLGVSADSCIKGIAKVRWPGRLEVIRWAGKEILIDCAHNVPAMETFLHYLKAHYDKPVNVIFGVLETKEWEQMLDLLIPFSNKWLLLQPPSSRAVSSAKVSDTDL